MAGHTQPHDPGMTDTEVYSIADVARMTGNGEWTIRRLFREGAVPETKRVGVTRVIFPDDLPAILDALRERGCPCKVLKCHTP